MDVPPNHSPSPKTAKPLPAHAFYVQRCILYSVSGRWPLPFAERRALYAKLAAVDGVRTGKGSNRLRRDWGTLAEPQQPAETLPDSHAQTANRFLAKRGWCLVKSSLGHWRLQRLANF
jgi:hypothetical protein